MQVLLQGFCLKSSNCDEIARKVAADITTLENQLSRGIIYSIIIKGCKVFPAPLALKVLELLQATIFTSHMFYTHTNTTNTVSG